MKAIAKFPFACDEKGLVKKGDEVPLKYIETGHAEEVKETKPQPQTKRKVTKK